jgi:inhibitor of cysteine peptidase
MVSYNVKLTTYALLGVILGSLILGSTQQFEVYTRLPEMKEDFGSLKRFGSASELNNFLKNTQQSQRYFTMAEALAPNAKTDSSLGGIDYSGTNVQVAGVDEADKVKTDGSCIYIARGTIVYIASAYPPSEAKLISKIDLHAQVGDLYIAGDKLAVFSQNNTAYSIEPSPKMPGIMPPFPVAQTTNIRVYDVTDRAKPTLDREIKLEGNYVASRMIGNYVYIIAQKGAWLVDAKAQPPMIQEGSKTYQIQPTDVLYDKNIIEPSYSYTTIMSVFTQHPDVPPQSETLLLGFSSTVYVSQKNLYLTVGKWSNTTIHKISLNSGLIKPVAQGTVPGWVLNQFSMDENEGYFRIATTTGRLWWGWRTGSTTDQSSAVYVLDQNMKIAGRLEGLAPKESIYSARFTGTRCYLVTFKKVDPLFVIDLTSPRNPTILGKLKIPGYSNYLHPYDENHVIGLGKNTVEAKEGDFAWYQGIKISLFDVTDVSNPKEEALIEVGDRGSDSPALSDHKAFLFNKERNLLIIPILEAKINPPQYGGNPPANAYGEYVYQGAYVFDISLKGINLRGRVTHIQDDALLKSGYWFNSEYSIERSLYIGDYLYTISGRMVKINKLSNLEELGRIILK